MRLKDKVAIITGSAGGMGKLAAELFAREGASVVVTDIAVQEGEQVAQHINETGGKAIFVKANVAREDEVKHMVEAAIDAFGQIDILYNNTGVMPHNDGSITDINESLYDYVIDINLKSAFLCTKHVVPHMIERGRGSIINISSLVVFLG